MKGGAFGASVVIALATACGRAGTASDPPADGGANGVLPAASLEAGTASNAAGSAGTAGPRTWSGTYQTSAGTIYVPDQLKVHWHPDDATSGLGDGPLTLTEADSLGTIRGTMGGPLGPAVVTGYLSDGNVTATIARRDPHDEGFAGVLMGKVAGARIEGTLNASPAAGGAVRIGTFAASADAGPAGH